MIFPDFLHFQVSTILIYALLCPTVVKVRGVPLLSIESSLISGSYFCSTSLINKIGRKEGRKGRKSILRKAFFRYFSGKNLLLPFYSEFTFLIDDARMDVSYFIDSQLKSS